MARIQPALAQKAVDAACRAQRHVFPQLADGSLCAVQLPDATEPWLVHACGDQDGDVFALQLLAGADALTRLHESQDEATELRGRMLLVAFVPRGEMIDRLREVADAAKFTEHMVPSFTVIDGPSAPRVPDAATLRQLVAVLGALVRAATNGELPSTMWRHRGGVHVPLLRASDGAAPEVLPPVWFDAPSSVPVVDVATLPVGTASWTARIVGMYEAEAANAGGAGMASQLAMLVVESAPGRLHCVLPLDSGVTLQGAAHEALTTTSPTASLGAAPGEGPQLPARIACADERLCAAFRAALAGRPVEVLVDAAVLPLPSAWASQPLAAADPSALPADGDLAAWRRAFDALLAIADEGHDVPPRPVRARFLGEGPLLARDIDLPTPLVDALRLYQFVFDRPHRGRRTHAERVAEGAAELPAASRPWLTALAGGELGVWCCEQDDGERVVVREALSGSRAVVVKAKANGLPEVGFAVGGLRVEVGGLSWWMGLSPVVAIAEMVEWLGQVGLPAVRRDVGVFGGMWARVELGSEE